MALRKVCDRFHLLRTFPVFTRTVRLVHEKDKEKKDETKQEKKSYTDKPPEKHYYDIFIEDYDLESIKSRNDAKSFRKLKESQRVNDDVMTKLGEEIGAAHFIMGIGGAIKLSGRNVWIRKDISGSYGLPRSYIENVFVEGIDASHTDLLYNGLDNICELKHLKFLNLSHCKHVDDFVLNRLQCFSKTLEVLDVSHCDLITENGIACIHHLPNLKVLNIVNTPRVKLKEVLTLYIEEMLPSCAVHGVDHDAITNSLEGTSHSDYELNGCLNTNRFITELCKTEEANFYDTYMSEKHKLKLTSDTQPGNVQKNKINV